MTHVTKRTILTDPRGRILTRTVERLYDDGVGGTSVVRTTAVARCRGCQRPVATAEQVAGHCGWCGQGPLCTACSVRCGVCARHVCGGCLRGFVWSNRPIAACPGCLRDLHRRVVFEQLNAARQAALGETIQRQRLRERNLAIRLVALRMLGQLQAVFARSHSNGGHRHAARR